MGRGGRSWSSGADAGVRTTSTRGQIDVTGDPSTRAGSRVAGAVASPSSPSRHHQPRSQGHRRESFPRYREARPYGQPGRRPGATQRREVFEMVVGGSLSPARGAPAAEPPLLTGSRAWPRTTGSTNSLRSPLRPGSGTRAGRSMRERSPVESRQSLTRGCFEGLHSIPVEVAFLVELHKHASTRRSQCSERNLGKESPVVRWTMNGQDSLDLNRLIREIVRERADVRACCVKRALQLHPVVVALKQGVEVPCTQTYSPQATTDRSRRPSADRQGTTLRFAPDAEAEVGKGPRQPVPFRMPGLRSQ